MTYDLHSRMLKDYESARLPFQATKKADNKKELAWGITE